MANYSYRKKMLKEETGSRCFYCGVVLGDKFEIDHIKPRYNGGDGSFDNNAITCKSCNRTKSKKTLEEFRNVIYKKLAFSLFYFEVIGITKVARLGFTDKEYFSKVLDKGEVWEHIKLYGGFKING